MDKRIFLKRGKASEFARYAKCGRSMVCMWRKGTRKSFYLDLIFRQWRRSLK
jgi:hypothetical protein